LDEGELQAIKDRLVKEGIRDEAIEVGRFKGLGEMNPDQLRETAMAPATRRVLPVLERNATGDKTRILFNLLMGKGEAAGRRAWMEENGHRVEADI
jgi:topoisomerase-4 subunit B